MIEQTKPPIKQRRVYGEDVAIIQDGITYHPHANEYIIFEGRPTVGAALTLSQMGRNEATMTMLCEQIIEWNWTNDKGVPFNKKPTVNDLMHLSAEEIGFIIRAASYEVESEEERKND